MIDPMQKFEWRCRHAGCINVVVAYSESTLNTLRLMHEEKHKREREFALGKPTEPTVVKDLNVLELTVADKAFLKTRGVKYD